MINASMFEFQIAIPNQGLCLPLTARLMVAVAIMCAAASGAEIPAAAQFRREVEPILKEYCSDCHADGESKGGVAFDVFKTDAALLHPELWFNVLKNTRAGLMPPAKKPRLSAVDQQKLERWIKYAAFGIDPKNPDPGRVTVRRLNRVEYRNTIRDLMGIDFNAEVEFPPDDTGYGFDNIGDVLTISPMLLEKYLTAAKAIVTEAVPIVGKVVPERVIPGIRFQKSDSSQGQGRNRGNQPEAMRSLSYYEPATVSMAMPVEKAGSYRVTLDLAAKGNFDYDPGRCRIVFKIDGREVLKKEFGWYDNKTFSFDFEEKWAPGDKRMTFELEPLTPVEKKINSLDMRIVRVTLHGPMEKEHWTTPKNYERFFTRQAPDAPAERRAYAGELLGTFAAKAFRRPVDAATADRLASLAAGVYGQPGKSFEAGIAHAMVAVLASPRFLFRLEEPTPGTAQASIADIDEYSLASRLSYFLWSTMPDDELLGLAAKGELRKNQAAQVKRMLANPRSEKMIQNFTGQWLQTRDVEGIAINARAVLARDDGQERQMRQQQEEFRAQQAAFAAARLASTNLSVAGITNGLAGTNAPGRRPGFGNRRFANPRVELDRDLRDAMRLETEMFVSSIVREDRPVTELIEADYTFLNEKLAKVYGLTNLNVTGTEMRRVTLPAGSPRGGVLTHGSALVVTSNPDRTSPVKRGLFILENFLGTPAPPPPPDIPSLEATEQGVKDRELTMREAMQIHREKPLCASCHARMDPIGLAFENFNAMGMWRDKERNQAIDTAGKLITGESFNGVAELKRILATEHKGDFYRCFTEKLMTYALGRGTEHYDVETIDQIVAKLEKGNGKFSVLLMGVIESAPFQKMRTKATETASNSAEPSSDPAATRQAAIKPSKP